MNNDYNTGWLLVELLPESISQARQDLKRLGFRVEKRGNLFLKSGVKKPSPQPDLISDVKGLSCRWYWLPRSAWNKWAGTKHNSHNNQQKGFVDGNVNL